MNIGIKRSLFITAGILTAIGFNVALVKQGNKETDKLKQKVLTTDPARYKRITNEIKKGEVANTYYAWSKEVQKMNDSLKIDSIAKSAYEKGAQMIRDSIKSASKLDYKL